MPKKFAFTVAALAITFDLGTKLCDVDSLLGTDGGAERAAALLNRIVKVAS